jgi:hypothetical protein
MRVRPTGALFAAELKVAGIELGQPFEPLPIMNGEAVREYGHEPPLSQLAQRTINVNKGKRGGITEIRLCHGEFAGDSVRTTDGLHASDEFADYVSDTARSGPAAHAHEPLPEYSRVDQRLAP